MPRDMSESNTITEETEETDMSEDDHFFYLLTNFRDDLSK
jgi:hypothetical protein